MRDKGLLVSGEEADSNTKSVVNKPMRYVNKCAVCAEDGAEWQERLPGKAVV